jgi:hypothetical protein
MEGCNCKWSAGPHPNEWRTSPRKAAAQCYLEGAVAGLAHVVTRLERVLDTQQARSMARRHVVLNIPTVRFVFISDAGPDL